MIKLLKTHYDIIIVGAGSAGCVLANRLSADPHCQVLLIEAGGSHKHWKIGMPAAVAKAIESPDYNWHYWTTAQANLCQRKLTTPRGKVLGGSSSINAMVYIRGHAQDYNRWAFEEGCESWSYQDVLPYFKAIETNRAGANEFRGGNGELCVGFPESGNPMFDAFIDAGQSMGIPFNDDFNGQTQEGVGYFQLNIHQGKRMSAADAFLNPVCKRDNLTVITQAQVLHLLNGATKITGVKCVYDGEVKSITADKVVLSSGAIGTPQLLLLSGIGPAKALEALDIKPIANLAGVGQNLQDHMEVKVKCRINQPLSLFDYTRFPRKQLSGLQYFLTRQGICRQQGLEAGAFLRLDSDSSHPDTQFHFINALAFDGAKAEDTGHGFAIDVTHLRPESRGELTLKSNNPYDKPFINPNYLATDYDLNMLREGIKSLRELCQQQALKRYIQTELFPSKSISTDAQLDQIIRETAESIYHPAGTAKMGIDDLSVVNPKTMEVYGVDNLFVADGSIMPSLVSANTNATCMMIGAKAAELIKSQL